MTQTLVHIHARDPISEAGVASELRPRPEVRVATANELERAAVVVVVVDSVDDEAVTLLRSIQRGGTAKVVLIAGRLDDVDLVKAVETGVVGIVRRVEATPDRLVAVIVAAAAGEGSIPSDLIGALLGQVGRLQRQVLDPRGVTFAGLASREVEVLRLVAEGLDTMQIARRLCYSERTVKNVLHDVTTRMQLRNRAHAVAYAVREGLI